MTGMASYRGRVGVRLPHRPALLATVVAVAGMHAWMLLAWPHEPQPNAGTGAATTMQVRQLRPVLTATGRATDAPAAPERSSLPAGPAVAVPRTRDAEAPPPRGARSHAAAAMPSSHPAGAEPEPGAEAAAATALRARDRSLGPSEAVADVAPAPIYATRPPGPATLHYQLRRGAAVGQAVLEWRPGEARYDLALVGMIGGAEALGWVGRGGFDEAGLAPERFVVRRRGRDLLAANFQRGAAVDGAAGEAARGRVTFSGPAVEWPLWPGVQDRVSWLLQLASILEAEPALGREGAQIVLWVIGARGDAGRWTLEARAPEALDLPGGRVDPALSFVREPQQSHDLRVEAWVDPQRGHLPVRLRFSARPSGEVTEFLLAPAPLR